MGEEKNRGGRPEVGPRFDVRLPVDLLKKVDAWAAEHEMTRASAVRHMVAEFFRRLERRRT